MTRVIPLFLALLLVGCQSSIVTTEPLPRIETKEVKVPVPVCPSFIADIKYPTRPDLDIDKLTPADSKDYNKVGKAYMQSIAAQRQYIDDLEPIVYNVRGSCQAINTNTLGK